MFFLFLPAYSTWAYVKVAFNLEVYDMGFYAAVFFLLAMAAGIACLFLKNVGVGNITAAALSLASLLWTIIILSKEHYFAVEIVQVMAILTGISGIISAGLIYLVHKPSSQ